MAPYRLWPVCCDTEVAAGGRGGARISPSGLTEDSYVIESIPPFPPTLLQEENEVTRSCCFEHQNYFYGLKSPDRHYLPLGHFEP